MPEARRIDLVVGLMILAVVVHAAVHAAPVWGGAETYSFIAATIVLTVFCLANAAHLLGRPATAAFLGIALVLGWIFEYLGVAHGFLFGPYHYTDVLGPMLGPVPIVIPFVWFSALYISYVLANLIVDQTPVSMGGLGRSAWLSLVAAFVMTAWDLALDPFMVDLVGAWVMENPGPYFTEPFQGFRGWVIVSFTISFVFRLVQLRIGHAPHPSVSKTTVAMPVVIYAIWCVFFALLGSPEGTRLIAVFAMGIPLMAACSGLARWDGRLEPASAS